MPHDAYSLQNPRKFIRNQGWIFLLAFLLIFTLSGCTSMSPTPKITAADQLATCLGSLTIYQLNQFEQQDAANSHKPNKE